MSFLNNLAEQRQRFLDGIEANHGDINLSVLDDFYPDEAHFIYELLQNAEDAGASEVTFKLEPHACYFEHNGNRHFNETDIRAITGIHNSSKKNNPDRIGKFGVGFKSVFVYTETPTIYSRDYSFKILRRVKPQAISPRTGLGDRTQFEFPFDNPKKNVKEAFAEVKSGLEQLSETTLLFLNNLQLIRWKVDGREGAVRRHGHSPSHIEVLKQVDGTDVQSSHWLRFSASVANVHQFTAPVADVEHQKVAVAFELAFRSEKKSFDPAKSVSDQLRIVPAVKGKVSVFFPAEKETSGLRFHLHAPFIPELSRASIKNSAENTPLFEQLAKLSARSLHDIKDMGLLTGDFLAVLPNNDDTLSERYKVIRQSIVSEMKTQSLVPSYTGSFASGSCLYQSRAAIKGLLSDEDLAFVTSRTDNPTWVISAPQRNQNQDKFLTSLGISSWDAEDLKDFLETRARVGSNYCDAEQQVDSEVMDWLAGKPLEWHQALYAILNKFCEEEEDFFFLSETKIVRMTDGSYSLPNEAYFQTGPATTKDLLARVDEGIFLAGTKKVQQADARRFLDSIGVKVPGELEEVTLLLQSRYGPEGDIPTDEDYLADLNQFIAYADRNPGCRLMMAEAILFRIDSSDFNWGRGKNAYIDGPIANTGLHTFYDCIKDNESTRWPLSAWYVDQPIELNKLVKFAEFAGVEREFRGLYGQTTCRKNAEYPYLTQVAGERNTSPIDKDFVLTRRAHDMLVKKTVEGSKLAWLAMCSAPSNVLQAYFQKNGSNGGRSADSQLICWLRDSAWVPQIGNNFVKPHQASVAKLPEGFAVDAGFKWLQRVEFNADEKKLSIEATLKSTKRAELGFKSDEAYRRALEFSKFSEDEQANFLSRARNEEEQIVEMPQRTVRNLELRAERVVERAKATPEKESIIKSRFVQLGIEGTKTEARLYLTDQYTNRNGQMICQACKGELPFKLPNGAYFFEVVEIVHTASKRFREGYLALCPNHAAAYMHANAQFNVMHEVIATSAGNEVELTLGSIETSLYFTQMHLADARACLESIENEEN